MDLAKEYLDLKEWLEDTKETPLEGMASFFGERVDGYEEHMARWDKHYEWMADIVPVSTKTLLDIGCGTGLELDCIFKRFPELQVTGVDLSEDMLTVLEEKHADKKLTLVQADYFLHDFGEACFDVAVSFETLHHFTAKKKTELFKTILRSLVPGGMYIECDYIAVSQEIEDLVFAECEQRRKRHGIDPGMYVHFDTPLTLEHEIQAIKNAGFSSVELLGFLSDDNHTAMMRAIK